MAGAALANNSSAELAAGGLVLTKTADIAMRSESLRISDKAVHVHYVFANTSGHDVSLLVAFPMPDITIEGEDDNLAVPTQNPQNFLAFRTTVDGRPVKANVEQKVIARGVDRTALLKSMGIPLAPELEATNKIIDVLPKAAKTKLIGLGLAQIEEYDVGKGMETHAYATWTLKTTYYWRQNFPANRTLDVEHDYTPATGGTAGTALGDANYVSSDDGRAYRAKYCIDDDFLAAVAHAPELPNHGGTPFQEERVDYILKTAGNWNAPIGDFTLIVDKGDPANLVSFCADGVTKVGATEFEVHKTNFTPSRDLAILIMKRERP